MNWKMFFYSIAGLIVLSYESVIGYFIHKLLPHFLQARDFESTIPLILPLLLLIAAAALPLGIAYLICMRLFPQVIISHPAPAPQPRPSPRYSPQPQPQPQQPVRRNSNPKRAKTIFFIFCWLIFVTILYSSGIVDGFFERYGFYGPDRISSIKMAISLAAALLVGWAIKEVYTN